MKLIILILLIAVVITLIIYIYKSTRWYDNPAMHNAFGYKTDKSKRRNNMSRTKATRKEEVVIENRVTIESGGVSITFDSDDDKQHLLMKFKKDFGLGDIFIGNWHIKNHLSDIIKVLQELKNVLKKE